MQSLCVALTNLGPEPPYSLIHLLFQFIKVMLYP